jgi:hypothetical protein
MEGEVKGRDVERVTEWQWAFGCVQSVVLGPNVCCLKGFGDGDT